MKEKKNQEIETPIWYERRTKNRKRSILRMEFQFKKENNEASYQVLQLIGKKLAIFFKEETKISLMNKRYKRGKSQPP